jgi:signal transduction histidine kinase
MSIRWKLLLISLVPTLVAAGLLLGYTLWSFDRFFQQTMRADLVARTAALTEVVREALRSDNPEHIQATTSHVGASPGVRARVLYPDGRLLASSELRSDSRMANWLSLPGFQEALQRRTTAGAASGPSAASERLYVAQPVLEEGRLIAVVRLSLTLREYRQQVQRNVLGSLVALGAILTGCAALSVALARSISLPIRAMSGFAEQIAHGHLGARLAISRQDELGLLATDLNWMSDQLAATDQARRAFLANVSHEFLTPVTNIQVTLEALQAGAAADPELAERFIENAVEETERLKVLVEELLDLGRLEAGAAPVRPEPCRLRELLERSVRAVESRLHANQVDYEIVGPEVEVLGDAQRLQQVFLTVLDNAVKYSAPETSLSLSLTPSPKEVEISIGDQGPGFLEEDLPRVFDAFYVGDPSRSGTGTGLGLAIARRIVEAHGGRISASRAPGGGARVSIVLPREARPPAVVRAPEHSPPRPRH